MTSKQNPFIDAVAEAWSAETSMQEAHRSVTSALEDLASAIEQFSRPGKPSIRAVVKASTADWPLTVHGSVVITLVATPGSVFPVSLYTGAWSGITGRETVPAGSLTPLNLVEGLSTALKHPDVRRRIFGS